ncbi:hypothetical protein CH063_12109 [Colletotrichum higginsianum]|uniref:Uncharacterized protein n=1 Tax=Colletotrichum higginsianum (strain IMI 349063) TaxID=759273 RepID=H1VP41_COLHI|nr:hypothetical protein CH063_12109 [Colletotrichum higginsianum]
MRINVQSLRARHHALSRTRVLFQEPHHALCPILEDAVIYPPKMQSTTAPKRPLGRNAVRSHHVASQREAIHHTQLSSPFHRLSSCISKEESPPRSKRRQLAEALCHRRALKREPDVPHPAAGHWDMLCHSSWQDNGVGARDR